MKVFISSVIHGYEEYREAAAEGVEVLGYEVSRSEEIFPPGPTHRNRLVSARFATLTWLFCYWEKDMERSKNQGCLLHKKNITKQRKVINPCWYLLSQI